MPKVNKKLVEKIAEVVNGIVDIPIIPEKIEKLIYMKIINFFVNAIINKFKKGDK